VRLNNASNLAGFARKSDLPFFLQELCGADYVYEPLLAPTRELRRVAETLDRDLFDVPTVLLCSEATPEHCHRRLVLEYLNREWGGIRALHL
jgi:uncharacterized protein (DUF488 family)